MKTYNQESKQYQILESWLNFDAERIAIQLGKVASAEQQQKAIDTMHAIINRNPEKYLSYSRGISLAAQIRQEQRSKIERWGEKAYCLSEKQLGVIAREIAELAALKVE